METAGNAYLEQVAASRELALTKEIAVWWRAFGLETYCVFTAKLLNRLGIFSESVAAFFRAGPTSPYIEQLSQDFLGWMSKNEDPLISLLAGFERALIRVKRGDPGVYHLDWHSNPDSLLNAILNGTELPRPEAGRIYRTTVAANIPRLVRCEVFESRAMSKTEGS